VEAAAAGECLEALEALLPETATALMSLVAAHASTGARGAFATRQLLAIAARCAHAEPELAHAASLEQQHGQGLAARIPVMMGV
jgi:hypothetical protein